MSWVGGQRRRPMQDRGQKPSNCKYIPTFLDILTYDPDPDCDPASSRLCIGMVGCRCESSTAAAYNNTSGLAASDAPAEFKVTVRRLIATAVLIPQPPRPRLTPLWTMAIRRAQRGHTAGDISASYFLDVPHEVCPSLSTFMRPRRNLKASRERSYHYETDDS
jgi:hypothetical protein